MRMLLVLLLIAPFLALAEEPLPIELTDEPVLPRAQVDGETMYVFTSYYDDMRIEEGLLIVTGTATADSSNPNVAQARAMAKKTAKFTAQAALIEFFTDIGFSDSDARTNAGYATEYGETDYSSDATVEVHLAINLDGEGGLVSAMDLTAVDER